MTNILELAEIHMSGPLEWGVSDCCTGSCRIFEHLHGVDPMRSVADQYRDKWGALKVIRQFGGWDRLADHLAEIEGLKPGRGERGEIGLVRRGLFRSAGGRGLVIDMGPSVGWLMRIPHGYAICRDRSIVSKAWRHG